MPELPEVEATVRLLDAALAGSLIESAHAPGINALKTFEPPLTELAGRRLERLRRRGKLVIVDVSDGFVLLMHLMSAGRLQLFEKRASPRDPTSRVLIRLRSRAGAECELRLREFGSKQAAWVKLLSTDALADDEALAKLGPDAWPDTPELAALLAAPRPLNTLLRDQRVLAGIGRAWADEILWLARLSPFKRGADLDADELQRLREATSETLGGALAHYTAVLTLPIPDRMPMPLQVHRHEGEPCPRCNETLRAVHYEDHVIAYCPACQTEGRVLKDRRMSRLLR